MLSLPSAFSPNLGEGLHPQLALSKLCAAQQQAGHRDLRPDHHSPELPLPSPLQ